MIEEVRSQISNLLETSGRAFLSIKFPRDFEVYFCSLELCSYEGETIDFFSFPILPNTISKKEPYVSNIKRTSGGITVIKNNDFIPQDLVLRGNFGRSFKILGGKEFLDFYGVSKFPDSEDYSKGTFSNIVKTGYGALKYLQGILERSKIFDGSSRLPRVLFFHNSTLGESYIVEVAQVQFDQNLGSNMMWNYNVNFNIIKSIDYGRTGGIFSLKSKLRTNTSTRLLASITSTQIGKITTTLTNSSANSLSKYLSEL